MKILCIDHGSNALDWLMRCTIAGHDCSWYVRPNRDGSISRAGEKLIKRVPDWEPHMRSADLIFVPDNSWLMHRLDRYHKEGYPIFGANLAASELEMDRTKGQAAIKKAGIRTIESRTFNDYWSAERYVKAHPETRFVSKPSGEADKAMSYVSQSAADMVYMLRRWEKDDKLRGDARKWGFIIQEFVPGVEMGVSGFFGPGGWSKWWCENWEHKKLMSGDMGPNTGEMGTVIRYTKRSKLAREVLEPFTDMLHSINYVGDIDMNCIVSETDGKPWPLELTMRPGWPSWHIQTSMHYGDPADWMRHLLDGHDTLEVNDEEVAIGVVVCLPDFPYDKQPRVKVEGVPVYGFDDLGNHHPSEMMWAMGPRMKDGKVVDELGWCAAGTYLAVVTGKGKTVNGARRSAYAAVRKIKAPNSPFYRDDIGEKLQEQLPLLQALGYAKDLTY